MEPKSGAPGRIFWLIAVLCSVTMASAQAAGPAWQADVYYTVGSIVRYNGHSYVALVSQIDYRDTGWNPTVGTLWKDMGAKSDDGRTNFAVGALSGSVFMRATDTVASTCAVAWNDTNVYTTGAAASRNGINYKANWWTQGEDPATHSVAGSGQPWSIVGSCAEGSKTADGTKASAPGNQDGKTLASDHAG